jgi:iron complex transport system substrate-binding protein
MRIVSLLPSLTELVAALGHAGELIATTHECDCPASLAHLPRLTRSRIAADASSPQIDAQVGAQPGSLYELDTKLLKKLRPDLILTQSQCDVCAVNEDVVRRAAAALPGSPRVKSVNPTNLPGVFAMFRAIAELLGADARSKAERLIAAFDATTTEIARRRRGSPPARVAHLEWIDPPYAAGHWVPEILERAGGRDVFGRAGRPSIRATWPAIADAAPALILAAPCGFSLERTRAEIQSFFAEGGGREAFVPPATRIALADGNAHFSRPGPRLEESIRVAAAAIAPEVCGDLAPPGTWLAWNMPA